MKFLSVSLISATSLVLSASHAFTVESPLPIKRQRNRLWANRLDSVPEENVGVPTPFIDMGENAFIECFIDSIATVKGKEYAIGVPCDHAVALCYANSEDQLVPIELEDVELMDDVFPTAESIVAEEFGEELVLQRTPQTLTLVGELEEDDEEENEDEDFDEDEESEDVEVLLSFEHREREYHLVRLLDPILLVGKQTKENGDNRVLLSPSESEEVMPVLEELFLEFHSDQE